MNETYLIGTSLLGVVAAYYQKKFNDIMSRIQNAPYFFKNYTAYDDSIKNWADQYSIDPTILKSLIYWESEFNPNAYNSNSGAQGLGQFTPNTWNWVWTYLIQQTPPIVTNPDAAIHATAAYLNYLLNKFDNNIVLALVAYNRGETKVSQLNSQFSGNLDLILGKVGSEAAYYGTAIPQIATQANAAGIGL